MRKNRMMRAASALMVAVLLTTSTISGTFAKYVTTDEAKDVARVAKWGVELQLEGNLFGETYVDEIVDSNNPSDLAVQSNHNFNAEDEGNPDDVVAPGTKNLDGFVFSINGTPEVSGEVLIDKLVIQNIFLADGTYGVMVKVDETVDVIDANNFKEFGDLYYKDISGKFVEATAYADDTQYYTLEDKVTLDVPGTSGKYYPVDFILKDKYDNGDDWSVDTLKEVADEIAEIIAGADKFEATTDANKVTSYALKAGALNKFNPNTNLATKFDLDAERITWEWKFERGTTAEEIDMYNGADTILGNLMAKAIDNTDQTYEVVKFDGAGYVPLVEFTDYCLNLKFEFAITVAQIDDKAGV